MPLSATRKTTTRHEATLDAADLREALGLPAEATLDLVPATDGSGAFRVRCAWSWAAEPPTAAVPPPPKRKLPEPELAPQPVTPGGEDVP